MTTLDYGPPSRGGAPLALRLARVTLRACTCGVEAHIHLKHEPLCAYRMVLEAAVEIERMRRALKLEGHRKSKPKKDDE